MTDVDKWDPALTEHVVAPTRPIVKRYFRSEVRGLDNIPPGASHVVSNHSGGLTSFDLSVFAVDYYDTYGYERPLYALGFDTTTPPRHWLPAPSYWPFLAGISTSTAAHQDRHRGVAADRHRRRIRRCPDVEHLDALVRGLMQKGLDNLAAKRRFPKFG